MATDRLPPLTALRAFEAAGRHLSFAQAAAELNVTPAALSFQIKSLETHLGQPLFRRLNRAVELTEAGRALLPGTTDGFQALAQAWRASRRIGDNRTLTVTAGPAFTAKWLAPRLFDFAQAHPDIELRFSASLRIMDFDRDEIDVAIRFGLGGDEGLFSKTIIDEWMTPMMTPRLAARYPDPTDLQDAVLLQSEDTRLMMGMGDWADWFTAAGLTAPQTGGPSFSQADHVIDAAQAGAGVVLGRISLTYQALADGTLVAPYPLGLRAKAHYRFVCPKGSENRPQVRSFLDWMLTQTSEMAQSDQGRVLVDPPTAKDGAGRTPAPQ